MKRQVTIPQKSEGSLLTSVRVPVSLLKEIEKIARRFGTTRNRVFVTALRDYVDAIKLLNDAE